jgi:hypothetical protein
MKRIEMSLNLADPFLILFIFWSGLPAFTQEVKRVMGVVHGQTFIQWKSSPQVL